MILKMRQEIVREVDRQGRRLKQRQRQKERQKGMKTEQTQKLLTSLCT